MAAAPTRPLLAAAVVLLLLAGAAEARPCKTIFFSYTVTSFQPRPFTLRLPSRDHTHDSFVFYRLDEPRPWPAFSVVSEPDPDSDSALPRPGDAAADEKILPLSLHRPLDGLGRLGGLGSLRDRTMDILYVVVALLLGVGCGLLTSAAVYLIWSFVAYGRHGGEDSDDEEEYERLDASGYVKIPDDPIKKGYEGN